MENNIPNKTLKKFAKIASEAMIDDPVYVRTCKNVRTRKKMLYHVTLLRLYASRKADRIYIDEEERGLMVLRYSRNDYTVGEFLKCPNWPMLFVLRPYVVKLFDIIGRFDNKGIFDDKTYCIVPIFVAKEHQRKGVAANLIKRGLEDMRARGCKIGLETQNPANLSFYEKVGFTQVGHDYYEDLDMHTYYMVIE